MKNLVWAALMVAAFTSSVLSAQDITGDWQGALKVETTELHLVLHIVKGADGTLNATLDSVDQGANGIPIGPVKLADRKVSFTIKTISGSYEGTVNAGATAIDGTWTQGQSLPLTFKRAAPTSDIDGAWLGTLDTGGVTLRIVFHFVTTETGLTATLDSLDQGAKGIPVTSATRAGSSLKLEMKQLGAAFDGKIAPDLKSIEGTFTQGGGSIPLVLKPSKDTAALERKRPQNPVKPYPYREEEVTYRNEGAAIQLAGTLTIPQGKGPFPTVLLITGSGQQDRDESLLGHKPFLVLADHLTRKGIAVLRVDDRGAGKSGGNFAASTSADFATDVEAGLAFLKTRAEVDKSKLGLVGHSEGGMIAPMVAARNPGVSFIVMMAGTGVTGAEILPAQVAAIMESSGQSHEEALKHAANEREILALFEQNASEDVIDKKMHEIASSVPDEQRKAQLKALQSPWFRFFLKYDPSVDLRKVRCPVLAINGEKDMQVLADQNLPAIRKALEAGGNKHSEIEKLPGLNHLFQTAKTGSPSEYADIEETISPVALNRISSWILKQ